jgi:hypothetical protein
MIKHIVLLFSIICFLLASMMPGVLCMICNQAECEPQEVIQVEELDCSQCESCCPSMSRCPGMKCEPIMPPEKQVCQTFYDPEDFLSIQCDCQWNMPHLTSMIHHSRHLTTEDAISESRFDRAISIDSYNVNIENNYHQCNLHNTISSTVLLL